MSDAIVPILHYAIGIAANEIPDRVTKITKAFLFDTIGLMVAGTKAPGCEQMFDQLTEWSGAQEATLVGGIRKLPAPYAAMGNALAAHAFDFDDTHERGDMHAYAVVVSAVMAAAERVGNIDGEKFLAAVTVGVDVAYRIGLGIKRYRGWHPTSTCGVFGAAIAAARVFELNKTEAHNAMGIAYSLSAGNFQCILDGSLTKRLQPAFASRAGVEAAIFASRGMTGAKNVLEGTFGFYPLYEAGEYHREVLDDRLGTWFEGEAASLKPYPSCRFCHGTIDAILDMVATDGLKPQDVDTVVVKMPEEAHDYVGGPYRPGDTPQVSAQFNTAYNVAVAIARGRVGFAEFEADSILDPGLRELADKVETIPTEEPYCFGPQEITVKTCGGTTFTRTVKIMKGHPDNPMSRDEQVAKVRECFAVGGKPDHGVEALLQTVDMLETNPEPLAGLFDFEGKRSLERS